MTTKIIETLQNKTIVDSKTGCWLWTGADDGVDGHGKIWFNGICITVSRLSCHLHFGLDLTDRNQLALHKLECPNKNCWNPEHLYVGNHSDNTRDSIEKGTHVSPGKFKTHCNNGHPLDGLRGNGKRYCKTCNRERANKNYQETAEHVRNIIAKQKSEQ